MHGGAPNKNIGDAFLLVWKFPKGCTLEDIVRVTSTPDIVEAEVSLLLMTRCVFFYISAFEFQYSSILSNSQLQLSVLQSVCDFGYCLMLCVYACVFPIAL